MYIEAVLFKEMSLALDMRRCSALTLALPLSILGQVTSPLCLNFLIGEETCIHFSLRGVLKIS